jgi:hypothetical protein
MEEHVVRMWEIYVWGPDRDTSEKEHLKNLGVDEEIILKWAFKN